jgi:hypothetical protein
MGSQLSMMPYLSQIASEKQMKAIQENEKILYEAKLQEQELSMPANAKLSAEAKSQQYDKQS